MEIFKPINLHQTRDFSRKMNATFEFVRQNFKPLGKAILMIAGPPVLLASVLLGSFFQDIMTASLNAGRGGGDSLELFMSVSFWSQILLMFVFVIVSTVATIATINNFIKLYDERQTNQIPVADIWQRVRETFWMYLGTAIQLTVLLVVFYVGLIIFIGLLADGGAVAVIGVILMILIMFYVFIGTSLVFIIRTYEGAGFFDALSRSFRLIYGKWWSTFGLLFVLYLLVLIISYIFMIPGYIIMFVVAFHDASANQTMAENPASTVGMITAVMMTLYYMVQMLMYALPNVGIAFQYFNLVERKEARGLMDQINTIGQPAPPPAPTDETY